MERHYTVSKDSKSGLWYAHMKGFPYIPVMGSFSKKNRRLWSMQKCMIVYLTK